MDNTTLFCLPAPAGGSREGPVLGAPRAPGAERAILTEPCGPRAGPEFSLVGRSWARRQQPGKRLAGDTVTEPGCGVDLFPCDMSLRPPGFCVFSAEWSPTTRP